jgi:formylglycine-generating enzyme required for sulfatase activity
MSGQIFISYRRDDAAGFAGRLYDRLHQRFPQNKIFIDVDSIDPGIDFVESIEANVGACGVLIAVIGKRWLISANEEGRRRLDNPEDFVRLEIATALKRGIRVIPVLVEGALMPQPGELPEDLKLLTRRNAIEVSHTRFSADSDRLIAALERVFEKTAAEKREGEEKARLEDVPQSQLPSPVATLTPPAQPEADKPSTETPKVVHPVAPKPSAQERVKPPSPPSGGIERKSPSKQVIAFLAIGAVLVVAGLIYLATRALQSPRPQPAPVAAVTPSPPAIATPTAEEKVPIIPQVAVQSTAQPTAPVAVAIPSPSISGRPTKEEMARRALGDATKEHPWVNSLGMKFVPVAGAQVLFSIRDTRVQDFEAFVADTNNDATGGMSSLGKDGWQQRGATWREPGFSQGPTHPVVGVSRNDAKKFCEWLTGREQSSGMLPRGRVYRLPTDAEWSAGVGLQGEEGNNPKEKSSKIKLYPWGKEWPPPKGAGNYAGEESKIGEEPSDWAVIKGYNDGYPRTSPVGSFAANANGLYDMGGNVGNGAKTGMTRGSNTA